MQSPIIHPAACRLIRVQEIVAEPDVTPLTATLLIVDKWIQAALIVTVLRDTVPEMG